MVNWISNLYSAPDSVADNLSPLYANFNLIMCCNHYASWNRKFNVFRLYSRCDKREHHRSGFLCKNCNCTRDWILIRGECECDIAPRRRANAEKICCSRNNAIAVDLRLLPFQWCYKEFASETKKFWLSDSTLYSRSNWRLAVCSRISHWNFYKLLYLTSQNFNLCTPVPLDFKGDLRSLFWCWRKTQSIWTLGLSVANEIIIYF